MGNSIDLWGVLVEALKVQGLDLPNPLLHEQRVQDINGDSLDLIEVLMVLEEKLGLPVGGLDEVEVAMLDTLGEVEVYLAGVLIPPTLM